MTDDEAAPGDAGTPPAKEPAAPVGWLPDTSGALFGEGAEATEAYGLLTVDVPSASWTDAMETCRTTLGCTYFDWLSAVDEPGAGFRVCAHLVALPSGDGRGLRRLLLRTTVPHENPELPTCTHSYAGAAWHERETHEMFGIGFPGHEPLEPLLLPDEFEGHPLRKDFVLAARVAKAWPGAKEPGESGHGGPKRRQMLPPGVPDPNEWGPLKGQFPPVPSRPARGRAAGDRPARRTRSAAGGSARQRTEPPAQTDAAPGTASGPAGSTGTPATDASTAPGPERRTPATPRPTDAPWHQSPPTVGPGTTPPATDGTTSTTAPAPGPAKNDAADVDPARADGPAQADPARADPAKGDGSSDVAPAEADPAQADAAKGDGSSDVAPAEADPAKVDGPAEDGPAEDGPAQADPAQGGAPAKDTPAQPGNPPAAGTEGEDA